MKSRNTVRSTLLRGARLLTGLTLALVLTSCTLGEAVMPSVAPGLAADRSVGVVAPVPVPIPHTVADRQECFACHAIGAVDAPPVPADHDQDVMLCTTCHAVWLAPVIAASAPPAIRHDLVGREDCLACHKLGTAGAPRIPANHASLTTAICQTCHTTLGDIVGVGEEEGVPVEEAPSIPHGLDGFGACTQCHEEGGPGIPRFPDDHRGRTDDLCSACHSPAAEAIAPTPATEPAATPTEAPPAAAGDAANGQVLYTVDCALCHGPNGEGTAIAPQALNDAAFLAGFTDEDLTTAMRLGVGDKMLPLSRLSDEDILDLIAFLRSWS
jgi:cytochrome c5